MFIAKNKLFIAKKKKFYSVLGKNHSKIFVMLMFKAFSTKKNHFIHYSLQNIL